MPILPPASGRARRLTRRLAAWSPRESRYLWIFLLILAVAACIDAIIVPARRVDVFCAVCVLVFVGYSLVERPRRRWQQDRQAVPVPARESRQDIPADVAALVADGERSQAIRRYRELTGIGLQEARRLIDSL